MSRVRKTFRRLYGPFWSVPGALALSVTLLLAACDAGAPKEGPRIQVLVTDLPSDYVASAVLYVSRVYLQGGDEEGEGEESGRVDLFNDPENPQVFDLLDLQGGLMFALTDEVEVPEGPYAQLRFVIDMAMVTLAEGYFFDDAEQSTTAELHVPSGSTSGVKVSLDGALVLEENETTQVIVDVDVNSNFVLQGNPESPAGIKGVSFTPHLEEIAREAN